MTFHFSPNETKQIISHFGQTFYQDMVNKLTRYSMKWKLEIQSFIEYYSVNCIFLCHSEIFVPAVLKIGNPSPEVRTEVNLLKEYNGGHFCKIFDSDIDHGVILEELIQPGTRLREEPALDKRLSVFSNLFNGLHIQSGCPELYPTYFEWVDKITNYMSKRDDYPELYRLMAKARDICSSLWIEYPKKLLLHGDLHHDNILRSEDQEYKIIDPKGVIGDPIFDIPRFILNEFYDQDYVPYDLYNRHIQTIASYFQNRMGIPIETILKCVFIETAMANCWNVEDQAEPNMHYVLYSEAMIDLL